MAFKIIAAAALAVGSFLLQALIPKKKSTADKPDTPTADYGVSIDRSWGEGERKAATITWASELVERKGKGGGGKGKNSGKGLIGSFQVVIGEGEFPSGYLRTVVTTGAGRAVLKQIYFNKKLWWSGTQTGKQARDREDKFTFYPGSNNQTPDATLVANLGAGNVPPYHGVIHIVFRDINVSTDSNGNYPTVDVAIDVVPSFAGSLNQRTVLTDSFARCGAEANRQLWEGIHYSLTPSNTSLANGMTFRQSETTSNDVVGQVILRVGHNAGVVHKEPFTPNFTIRAPGTNVTALRADKNIFWEGNPPTNPITMAVEPEETTPGAITISYRNRRNNFEPLEVSVENPISTASGSETITLAMSYTQPNTAVQIARRVLLSRAYGRTTFDYANTLPLPSESELGSFNALSYDRTLSSTSNLKLGFLTGAVQTVTIGADFNHQISSVQSEVSLNLGNLNTLPEPSDQNNTEPDTSGVPTILWFEGPRTISPTTNPPEGRTVNTIIARELGEAPYTNVQIAYTDDLGASFTDLVGVTADSNAVRAPGAVLSRVPPIQRIGDLDNITTLTVTVDGSVNVEALPVANVFDPVNTLFLPRYGLVRYTTAELIAPNRYRLSGFLWNILDTAETRGASTETLTDVYFLESTLLSTPVPSSIVAGTANNFHLVAEFNGLMSNVVNSVFTANPASESQFDDLNRQPRPVKNVVVTNLVDRVRVEWDPGENQNTFLDYPLLAPRSTVTNNYWVYLVNPAVAPFTIFSTVTVSGVRFIEILHSDLAVLPGSLTDYEIAIEEQSANSTANLINNDRWSWQLFP